MKRFLMITLTAITAVALVTAPGWAAGGRKLSDRQLANVHAGNAVADAHSADSSAESSSSGDIFIAGAASSAAAATASDVASALAVKINNKCAAGFCKLKVETEAEGAQSTTTTNAQSILNTVASVNAVQVNVVGGTGGTQTNTAYSAEGAIGEIDSAENGAAAASADTLVDTTSTPPWASADSSASAATSASSTLAFATPRVEIKNRCAAGFCKLQVETEAENGGTVTTNAQSILNTVASVNAVQINVAASGSTLQSNTAYSTK